MNRGYVKMWRKSIDGGWLTNHKLWAFWCWCLMKASHKECDVIVGYQKVHLMPGDFIFGRKTASKELGMSERSIRTILDFLKSSQNLTIKTTNKFSIISIINWGTYQQDAEQNDQLNDQQPTSNRPATDQQVATNKNVKNVKNVKKEKNGKKIKKQNADALFVLPDWIPEETWAAYMALREKKRAAKTTYALNLIVKELIKIKETHNHDPVTVLNKSIKNGWIDVYPLKESDIVEQKKSKWFPDRPASGRMQ